MHCETFLNRNLNLARAIDCMNAVWHMQAQRAALAVRARLAGARMRTRVEAGAERLRNATVTRGAIRRHLKELPPGGEALAAHWVGAPAVASARSSRRSIALGVLREEIARASPLSLA